VCELEYSNYNLLVNGVPGESFFGYFLVGTRKYHQDKTYLLLSGLLRAYAIVMTKYNYNIIYVKFLHKKNEVYNFVFLCFLFY
ncbi:hypothetical protein II906_08600, partial [bacterium]|nr:hypothetical protein [bacterium]